MYVSRHNRNNHNFMMISQTSFITQIFKIKQISLPNLSSNGNSDSMQAKDMSITRLMAQSFYSLKRRKLENITRTTTENVLELPEARKANWEAFRKFNVSGF